MMSVDAIRRALADLGRRIEAGDESELLVWVIPSQLACSHRPLRHNRSYGGSLRNIDEAATPLVHKWAKRVSDSGIRSIICLMSEQEVDLYARLNLEGRDLLRFYRDEGFEVASIPWKDPAHVRKNPLALKMKQKQVSDEALARFDTLPKPVLLHCSAGLDRSAPVAAFIREKRSGSAA